jgi:hypothetical protein
LWYLENHWTLWDLIDLSVKWEVDKYFNSNLLWFYIM